MSDRTECYNLPATRLLAHAGDESEITPAELAVILRELDDRELTFSEVIGLINALRSSAAEDIKSMVIETSTRIRTRKHGRAVVPMAPVEVTNRCSSNCVFCGWRASNQDMRRLTISAQLVVLQTRYLVEKGIHHIELVGGDDTAFVRDTLPSLLPEIRNELPEGGMTHFCTMALTGNQYRQLRHCGADSMIMWQETYDADLYHRSIPAGPKARGIDENFRVRRDGDGFRFRLESQDRAVREGLAVSVGSMLGLNPNLGFEMLATIDHARYLCETYRPEHPVIVGMPTWNHITTPQTDRRPEHTLSVEESFSYLASVYFLALHLHDVWVFPNCRVSIAAQADAVRAAGVFTSTEVKLGPGGYLAAALGRMPETDRQVVFTELPVLRDEEPELDEMEQFRHHHHPHEEYVREFAQRDLFFSTEG
jgi:2-iminoacetate synthase ThiH